MKGGGGGDELTIRSTSHYIFDHLQNTISHVFENYASCLDIVIMVITFKRVVPYLYCYAEYALRTFVNTVL